MNVLESWVRSPLAEAIGWTLLHSLWQGLIIAAVLAALLVVQCSSRGRYAVACVAMIAIAVAFIETLLRAIPEAAHGAYTPAITTFPIWNQRAAAQAFSPWAPSLVAIVPWLAPVWLVGVWISCVRHFTGLLSVRRLRNRGVCSPPDAWRERLAHLRERLQLLRTVQLLESSLVEVPIVLGHFRPLILIPVGLLTQMPVEQVEAILLHELAHIRRQDYLFNLVQRVVEGLLFYHPAVWWISHVIRIERENCCDDMVVAVSGNAHEYASALAALEERRWPDSRPAIAASGGNLMKRIHRLLYPRRSHSWTPLLATIILMTSAAATLLAWHTTPAQIAAAGPRDADAYKRWVSEEVAYRISDQERAAFLSLRTNEERERFIEQFWLRRDPTPGTPVNEAKNEHYRRLEYANQKWTTKSGKGGWQTDRGRVYIMYGPPDEIESHPSGRPEKQKPVPFEVWKYNHMEGLGDNLFITFIDGGQTGDFQIAPGNPFQ